MSTKVLAIILTILVCATILVAAAILDEPDPSPAPATFDFCPPRLESC